MQGGSGRRERDKELTYGCDREREKELRHVEGGEREREKERKSARIGERKRFGSSSPGPALCKLGLARSAVHST